MSGRRVTIVGNGAGGVAAAALLASEGTPVTLYGRSGKKVRTFGEAGAISVVENGTRRRVTDTEHTTDLEAALAGRHLIVVMVPTSAVPSYATVMAPHLEPDAVVLLAPGHTGGALAFRRAVSLARPELARIVVAETFTLPFVTRMTGPCEVTIWRRVSRLLTGVLPASATAATLDLLRPLFPDIVPARSVIESSMSNLNAIMHPPGMLTNIGWIERTGGDFRFYREGVTPGVARVMDALDAERVAVAARLGVRVPGFVELFHSAGLVADEVAATGDTYQAIHESGPNREIRSPASLMDRYVAEDVGCGLVALAAIAKSVDIPVPMTEALITVADAATGCDYRSQGLNATRLGIKGLDRPSLLELVG